MAGNIALISERDTQDMEQHHGACEHRWRYFVNVQARAIRVRECEHCGKRTAVATKLEPLPRRHAERLTA